MANKNCKDCTLCENCNKSSSCDQSNSCNKSNFCNQSSSCDKSYSCNQSYFCDKSNSCDKCENLLYCNDLKFKEFRVFNKPVSKARFNELKALDSTIYQDYPLEITKWIEEKDMTKDEKEDNPNFSTTNGCLKIYSYQEAWKNLWNVLPQDRKNMLTEIEEFDAEIFKEITGIDVEAKGEELTLE